ncbi:MAG: cation:proton antiporter [Sphingomicrobium sp.]
MTGLPIATIGVLLLVACLIAIVCRKLGLPYIVGLVVAGFLIALLPDGPQLPLSRSLIFDVLLPPLVFEAALELEWKRFRRELPITLTFAFVGVAIAAAVVAGGMHWLVGWSWIGAALFGILIAATDPVSVIATFRELGAEPRVRMVVESESLLNDGVAAVGFAVVSAIAAGSAMSVGAAVPAFLWALVGGLTIGGLVAGTALLIAGRTDDVLIEITLTTIAAYASLSIAEHLHASGVIATLTAGLIVGNVGSLGAIADSGRNYVLAFWTYVAFLANSFVFILIGMHTAAQPLGRLASLASLTAVVLVLVSRAISIYPLAALFRGSKLSLPAAYQHTLFWGGLRGALALALALAVPATVPERSAIIVAAFVVVAFSIVVQGLTMPVLLRRLGLSGHPPEAVAAPPAAG